VKLSWTSLLMALVAMVSPFSARAAILPVSNGLVLNFQADNIDGSDNSTLTNGQEVTAWNDIVEAGGHPTANNADVPGAVAYSVPGQGTPNYVAGPVPGVQFTRVTGQLGDALGFDGTVDDLTANNAFTAFVLADLTGTSGTPARILQFGRRNAANHRIVGLANSGFRFNGGSKVYAETMFDPGVNLTTYTMDMTQLYSAAGYRFDEAAGTAPVTAGDQLLNLTSFNQGFVIGAGKSNTPAVIDTINGVVHAIVVYNRVLTAQEIDQVEDHLLARYAVVPEPASWGLAALAVACCGMLRRR
jgi:hypothetical protein